MLSPSFIRGQSLPCLDPGDNNRHRGDQDHASDYDLEVINKVREGLSEQVACHDHSDHPDCSSDKIIDHELPEVYFTDAREYGDECPHYRKETTHDESKHTVAEVDLTCDVQVFFLIEEVLSSSVQVILCPISESIAHGCAAHGGNDNQQDQPPYGKINVRRIAKKSRDEQQ